MKKKTIKTNFDHYAKQLCIAILQNPDIGPLNVVRCFALDHGAETRGMKTATKQFVLDWLYAPYGKVTSVVPLLRSLDTIAKNILNSVSVKDSGKTIEFKSLLYITISFIEQIILEYTRILYTSF